MVERIQAKPRHQLASYKGKPNDGRHASRVARGRDLLPDEDGRSRWARLLKATLSQLITHCGGDNAISQTRRMACRRIAALEAELVFTEDRIASIRRKGREPPASLMKTYASLTNQQRQLSRDIGWDRTLKDAKEITLDDYISERAKAKANGHRNGRARPMTIEHEG